ncbi:hypothetical protein DFH08DRAFT_796963 [Mycena albidolilacea]|uniref:Uncharacterized protein n=1 Tax=Mycena albidolilacea TaxID=1033008 RepID=A0AAD7AWM1_9AGAR|nr:hypothetical protein DFH08DRAFT_796963 [Mycena albidolilacea]
MALFGIEKRVIKTLSSMRCPPEPHVLLRDGCQHRCTMKYSEICVYTKTCTMDIGTLMIKCEEMSQYVTESASYIISLPVWGQTKQNPECLSKKPTVAHALAFKRTGLPLQSSNRAEVGAGMSLDTFVQMQSNLLQRNFHGFNFGDRDKVWSEGNTIGGEELGSRQGGEKFGHIRYGESQKQQQCFTSKCTLLCVKVVSHGNACDVRRSTHGGRRRVHGKAEEETKPSKTSHGSRGMLLELREKAFQEFEVWNLLIIFAQWLSWTSRELMHCSVSLLVTALQFERSLATHDPEALSITIDPTQVIEKAEFATLHRVHLRDHVKGQSSENSARTI